MKVDDSRGAPRSGFSRSDPGKGDPARAELLQALQKRVAGKAKPIGSMGRLEDLAISIGLATGSTQPDLGAARLIVFAGDHGITAEGVSTYPSMVTGLVTKMILDGQAGANVCLAAIGADVIVVDAGLLTPLPDEPGLINRNIRAGTRNARREPAMTLAEYQEAFDAGHAIVMAEIKKGAGLFALGEVGIGNTSAAALLAHAATDLPLAVLVGPGAGMAAKALEHKRAVLHDTYARAFEGEIDCDPRRAFVEFAGYEMVMMAGAIAAVTEARKIAIIDGFIGTAVAAALFALEPQARQHCVFAHASGEPGHKALLKHLEAEPLLDLGMRLGEGTGAALAIPLVRAAEKMLTRLADFDGGHPDTLLS
ncbi:MAG: nicotinate-nucleotide--dimethylbenzimidazole phosphoribosyltransferase [Hyphomicrobium aestuarii]|nr:nicotinate-nucleotide--dimethylbenzimidazole phosphoribosyltransferase [Hyphomicrobium aestuarii]